MVGKTQSANANPMNNCGEWKSLKAEERFYELTPVLSAISLLSTPFKLNIINVILNSVITHSF